MESMDSLMDVDQDSASQLDPDGYQADQIARRTAIESKLPNAVTTEELQILLQMNSDSVRLTKPLNKNNNQVISILKIIFYIKISNF